MTPTHEVIRLITLLPLQNIILIFFRFSYFFPVENTSCDVAQLLKTQTTS